jgi:uncharacterized protein (DUF1501 family)
MTHDHTEFCDFDSMGLDESLEGCEESRLLISRRGLMGLSVGLFSFAFAPRIASAAGAADPRLLVVLLRGGLDGLNVLPYFGNGYGPASRGSLALDESKQLDLGNGFAGFKLNAVMTNYHKMFTDGQARVVLPIAPPLQTRSHFDCAFNLENGHAKSARSDSGWLNRLFASVPENKKAKLRGMPLQIGNTPVILSGAEPVLSWTPWVYNPDFFKTPAAASLTSMYANTVLASKFRDGAALNAAAAGAREDSAYSDSLQRGFIGAARLLGAEDGPRVAVITVDSFDSHVNEAANTARTLANFDKSLGLFRDRATSLGFWDKTVIVCVSEFGRTVSDNSKGGSDHGIGTTALLAGGAINGSRIFGEWPNLTQPGVLADNNDVRALYDTRDLFKAILREHLDISDAGTSAKIVNEVVFPGVDTLAPGIRQLGNVIS